MAASLTYQQSTSDRVRYNSGFSSSTIGRQECLLAHLKTRAAWLDIIIVANSVDGPIEKRRHAELSPTSFPGSYLYLQIERGPWERGCDLEQQKKPL